MRLYVKKFTIEVSRPGKCLDRSRIIKLVDIDTYLALLRNALIWVWLSSRTPVGGTPLCRARAKDPVAETYGPHISVTRHFC